MSGRDRPAWLGGGRGAIVRGVRESNRGGAGGSG